MNDDQSRPTWQDAPCPSWCTRAHHEDDHPEDRRHQDDGFVFAAVVGVVDPTTMHTNSVPGEVIVRRYQEVDEDQTWLLIGCLDPDVGALILAEAAMSGLATALRRAS